MNQAKVSALLGRPLTATETTNFDLYLKIARESLEEMLCTTLCDSDDPKIYDARRGYSTVFTDVFTDLDEVKLDGEVIDESKYSVRQWEKRNGKWYNSIVFNDRLECQEVEVSANWGFGKYMPADLQALYAGLFDLVTKKNKLNKAVQSKQTEDFRITFNTGANLSEELDEKYGSVVRKYNLCNVGNIRHGEVC